jgi:uncharacterized membrane protein YeaQ/YmgE (transglycosylase-associated protein family)
MPLPLGLLSWLAVGLIAGLSAGRMLPGEPRLGHLRATAVGLGGALAGGLLATAMDFGGLVSVDLRSLVTAALAAVLCLLLLRYLTLRLVD